MEIAKVTSKGQLTVPKAIRQKLDLEPGSKVVFLQKGNDLVVRKAGSIALELTNITQKLDRSVAEQPEQYDSNSPVFADKGDVS